MACSVHILTNITFIVATMEESGEQCIVVFAFVVTEPASECVCVATQPTTRSLRNNQCKDDSALLSRFRHGGHPYR